MRVLITGATGFIGSHVLKRILQNKWRPVILVRNESNIERIATNLPDCEIRHWDKNLESLTTIGKVDCVIHLATKYLKKSDTSDLEELISANLSYGISLFEWSRENKVKKFINLGTFFETSKLEGGLCVKSQYSLNAYAAMKHAFGSYIASRADKISVGNFRLFTPYGENDNDKLIRSLINAKLNGDDFRLANPDQLLDFIYVKDVVDFIIGYIENHTDSLFCDLGTGKLHSLHEVEKIIKHIIDGKKNDREVLNLASTDYSDINHANLKEIPKDLVEYIKTELYDGLYNTVRSLQID